MKEEIIEVDNIKIAYYDIGHGFPLLLVSGYIAPKEEFLPQIDAFKDFNLFNRLSLINTPVLLIAASHDRILPNSQMFEMNEKIRSSSIKVIKKAGHGSLFSRAPEINQLILDFLTS